MISFLLAITLVASSGNSTGGSENCGSHLRRIEDPATAARLQKIIETKLLKKGSDESLWRASQNFRFKPSQFGVVTINGEELLLFLSSDESLERPEAPFNREFVLIDSDGRRRHEGVIPYKLSDDRLVGVYAWPAAMSGFKFDSLVFRSEQNLLYAASINPSRRSKIEVPAMSAEQARQWARSWRSDKIEAAVLFWVDGDHVLASKTVVENVLAVVSGNTSRMSSRFQFFSGREHEGLIIEGTSFDAVRGFKAKNSKNLSFVLFQKMRNRGPNVDLIERNPHYRRAPFKYARMLGVMNGSELVSGYQPEGDVEWAEVMSFEGAPVLMIYERSLRSMQRERRGESFVGDQVVFIDALSMKKIFAFRAEEAFARNMSPSTLKLWRYLRHSYGIEKRFVARAYSD